MARHGGADQPTMGQVAAFWGDIPIGVAASRTFESRDQVVELFGMWVCPAPLGPGSLG